MDERAAVKTIANAIKHRKYLAVAIVALFLIAAGVASIVRTPVYQGTALMFVDERFNSSQGFDLALQAGELLSAHFIQIATSRSVLDRACSGKYFDTAASTGVSCTADGLGSRVSANTVKGTDWIGVYVTAPTAAESAALANAVARAMLDQDEADVTQLLAPTSDYLQAEIKRLNTAIAVEQAAIAQLQRQHVAASGVPAQQAAIATHQTNLALLQSQYAATYTQSQNLVIEKNRLVGSLTLAQPAIAPTKPIDPNPLTYLAVGLIAGLCVAFATVLLVDRFDDRLFEGQSLSDAAGTPLVIAISNRPSRSLSGRSPDPYALARANLLAQNPDLTKLLVVAASPTDRVRQVAAGLGIACVQAGLRVLVVDAESQSYVMHQQSVRNGSRMTIISAAAAGDPRVPNEDLADGEGKYDLTILSAPSPDSDPTAVSLAHTADIAIVVATARRTRFSDVRRTAETLRLAGIKVSASVLVTDPDKESPATSPRPETALYDMAVNQSKLPTWRGPSGS
jgi:capsular polysaccharide biosynthesis protein